MRKQIDEVSAIVERVKNQCPMCRGTGQIAVPEYLKPILISRRETWECLECFGTGVKHHE